MIALATVAAGLILFTVAMWALLGWIPVAVIGALLIAAGVVLDLEALSVKHPRATTRRRD